MIGKNIGWVNKMSDVGVTGELQLQVINGRILELGEQYKQRHREWLDIKYRLVQLQMANDITGRNINSTGNDLKLAIKIQQHQHTQIDTQFKHLLHDEYLLNANQTELQQKNVVNKINRVGKNDTQYDDNGNSSGKGQDFVSNLQMVVGADQQQVRIELNRQRHQNETLYKEIQMLEKQYTTLKAHTNNTNSDTKNTISKHMQKSIQRNDRRQISNYNDNDNDDSYENYQQTQRQIQVQTLQLVQLDCELESQIGCLNKLIQKRLSVIESISQQNEQLQQRVGQLKARQSMLEKKRHLLSNQQSILQKRLDKSISQMQSVVEKDGGLKADVEIKGQKFQQRKYSRQNTIMQSAFQSAQEITHLINSQLSLHNQQQSINQLHHKININPAQL